MEAKSHTFEIFTELRNGGITYSVCKVLVDSSLGEGWRWDKLDGLPGGIEEVGQLREEMMPIYFGILNYAVLMLLALEAKRDDKFGISACLGVAAWVVLVWGIADFLWYHLVTHPPWLSGSL